MSFFNPPRGVQVSAKDQAMLDALNAAYQSDIDSGVIAGDVVVVPDIVYPSPSVDGFIDFVEEDLVEFIKTDVKQEIADNYYATKQFVSEEVGGFVDFTGDQISSFETKVLPNPLTAISGLGVIAFAAAIGLIVAAKHL